MEDRVGRDGRSSWQRFDLEDLARYLLNLFLLDLFLLDFFLLDLFLLDRFILILTSLCTNG
tara:strand:- start:248 stop:430 length:183 start_codon:yes stop_codon:yes gene_type:complete